VNDQFPARWQADFDLRAARSRKIVHRHEFKTRCTPAIIFQTIRLTGRLPTSPNRLGKICANTIAMKRSGTAENDMTCSVVTHNVIAVDSNGQWSDPRVEGKFWNFILERTQSVTPDLGR
jgi:hypothetical protein